MGVDLIGSGDKIVAIVEVDEDSKRNPVDVANEIMSENKNVKTVLERVHGVRGKFRLREHKIIVGDEDTEVAHKEYGYTLKMDPRFVYFSPRESTIRQHISKQVRPDEKILVMFAGVGPYPVCICKTQPKVREVVAVEANPKAVDYMRENVRINKLSHMVTPLGGDVNEVCIEFKGEFDRVIMPMIEAREYLELASRCTKPSGTIYVYMVSDESNLYNDCKEFVRDAFKRIGRAYDVVEERKIALYSPGKWKVLIALRLK